MSDTPPHLYAYAFEAYAATATPATAAAGTEAAQREATSSEALGGVDAAVESLLPDGSPSDKESLKRAIRTGQTFLIRDFGDPTAAPKRDHDSEG